MKVSDYIANTIERAGAGTVFGFQGSNVTHLVDSIARAGLRYLQGHHEQASAFAANAYSEVSGTIGVALSSSGPGAINMIGGVANAWFDSVPVLFLTGQLNAAALRKDTRHRQQGFQEFDIVSTVADFTKYAVTVLNPEDIRYHAEKALFLASSGRMGPVLLDIPHNVQTADVDIESARGFLGGEEHQDMLKLQCATSDIAASDAHAMLMRSERPLLLLGGGARALKGGALLKAFIERYDIPVVASLKGLDMLPHNDPHFVGFIGSWGNRYANLAVAECDLLVALGSRFDPRQTGDYPAEFAKGAKIIHVDIDENELNHNVTAYLAVQAPCGDFLERLMNLPAKKENTAWRETIAALKGKYPSCDSSDSATIPNTVIAAASSFFSGGDIVTADVGQNQMWTAQSVSLRDDMALLNSGGLGSMGYALPAAIGAAAARPGAKILCVAGDGGIQMNLQELGTVAREAFPIKILVMNNRSLGLIRSYQNIVFDNTLGSVEGFSSPDYEKIAAAYGIGYVAVETADDLARHRAQFENRLPLLCEVKLAPDTEIHPEPAYRQPVHIQSPLV